MIKDEQGLPIARYTYDEWGNCVVTNLQGTIGNLNPFRYRGYYYDTESGLYYLMSRYYDPEIGQFISMDTSDYLAPDTIGGVDLYAYCNNNPIMYVDSTGHAPKWWQSILIGVGLIAVAALVATVIVYTGGGAAAFFAVAGQAALGGLKIAAVAVEQLLV